MKKPYVLTSIKRYGYEGPFDIVKQRRSWGMQSVLVFAGTSHTYITSLSFNGNSKQRRQQRRALLRELNK